MSGEKPVLGYWKIRGLGQPIRLLLAYLNVDFEDKRYEFADPPNIAENWLKDKFNLGLPFPNLPYYIDGNIKLSQHQAILRHLARKYNLTPNMTEEEEAAVDVMENQIHDTFFRWIMKLFGNQTAAESREALDKEKYFETALKLLSDDLGTREWIAINRITFVDFKAAEVLDWIRLYKPAALEQFPNLVAYLNRFEQLPAIKAFRASPEYIDWPLFGPIVNWGFKRE